MSITWTSQWPADIVLPDSLWEFSLGILIPKFVELGANSIDKPTLQEVEASGDLPLWSLLPKRKLPETAVRCTLHSLSKELSSTTRSLIVHSHIHVESLLNLKCVLSGLFILPHSYTPCLALSTKLVLSSSLGKLEWNPNLQEIWVFLQGEERRNRTRNNCSEKVYSKSVLTPSFRVLWAIVNPQILG